MSELRLGNREQPDTLTMVAWSEPLPGGGYGPRERRYVAIDALLSEERITRGARALGGYTPENGYADEDWAAAGDAFQLREQAERVLRAALSEKEN